MKSSTTTPSILPLWTTRAGWLAAIPVLTILCLAAMSRTESAAGYVENNAPQLEGSWSEALTVNGQLLPGGPLISYAAGGALVLFDTTVFPDWPMNTPYHGTWARVTGRDFVFTAMAFRYDPTVDPAVMWKIISKVHLTIEPGGDAYNGKGTTSWYFPNGDFGGSVEINTHGTRIKAE